MAIVSNVFLKAGVPYRVGPSRNDLRSFSPTELRTYVENTRRMMREGGLSVPVLSEHAPPGSEEGGPVLNQFADALKTAGWLQDVRYNEQTGEAQAFYDITSRPYLAAIQEGTIRFTSPELREEYTDGLARSWGPTFAHFALTPKPRNPAQTQLSVGGPAQFAMQFSMADAVGIPPEEMPVLQFVGNHDYTGKINRRKPGAGGARQVGMRNYNTNADLAEEKGPDSHTRGGVRPIGPGSATGEQADGAPMWGAGDQVKGMGQKRRRGGVANGAVRQPTNKNFTPKYGRTGKMPTAMSEQFDYSITDPALGGFPQPGGNTMQGPYGSGNAGMDAMLDQSGISPHENPDVIRAPDEAKRQKSEAITQLCSQVGLEMPADTDWTTLDDGTLGAFLAALKTLVRAESDYEMDAAQQQQDQQLKEQVPMAAQMSLDDAYETVGRTILQFAAKKKKSKQLTDEELDEVHGYYAPHNKNRERWPEYFYQPERLEQPTKKNNFIDSKLKMRVAASKSKNNRKSSKASEQKRKSPKSTSTSQMSLDTDRRVIRQVAAQKQRIDQNARHGLRQYIANAPIPPGIKAALSAKVSSVQFSEGGSVLPTFTVAEVVNLLVRGVPQQYSEDTLLQAGNPRQRQVDRGERAARREISRRLGDRDGDDVQFAEPEDVNAYYDGKRNQPGWDRMMIQPNGNGRH